LERRAQERGGGPFERCDDFFVVIEQDLHVGDVRQQGFLGGEVPVGGSPRHQRPFGTLVHLPGGSTHWFRFGPGGGEMISMTSRAGAAAFFADVDREVSPTEPDFGVLLGVASSHDLTVLPVS